MTWTAARQRPLRGTHKGRHRARGGGGTPFTLVALPDTYSPKLNQFETDADSSFTLPFDLSQAQPAPFTTIATM